MTDMTERPHVNKLLLILPILAWCLFILGCVPKESEHKVVADTKHQIEIKPIHITVDVNIKVDKQLDNFFDFEDTAGG